MNVSGQLRDRAKDASEPSVTVSSARDVAVISNSAVSPVAIRTSLDKASKIRNPVSAWAYKVGTNSQISALENAERLATATTKTAEAEAKALDALTRSNFTKEGRCKS